MEKGFWSLNPGAVFNVPLLMSWGCTSPLPWRLCLWDYWLGKCSQHGSGLPSISPLCNLHLESIELNSNFWNICHMREFQETCLHKLFSHVGDCWDGIRRKSAVCWQFPRCAWHSLCLPASWVLLQPLERDAFRRKANATCLLLGF